MRVFIPGPVELWAGRWFAQLCAAGREANGMTRSQGHADAIAADGAEEIICDAFDAGALEDPVRGSAPEVVVHLLTGSPPRLDRK